MKYQDAIHKDYKPGLAQMQGQVTWTMTGGALGYDPGMAANFGEGGLELKWPQRVYDNQSLNVKLAAAKEWLKSREKK
jgi:hypothetical protein